jgi:hypothetical protein
MPKTGSRRQLDRLPGQITTGQFSGAASGHEIRLDITDLRIPAVEDVGEFLAVAGAG